jgi:hypothetical protein
MDITKYRVSKDETSSVFYSFRGKKNKQESKDISPKVFIVAICTDNSCAGCGCCSMHVGKYEKCSVHVTRCDMVPGKAAALLRHVSALLLHLSRGTYPPFPTTTTSISSSTSTSVDNPCIVCRRSTLQRKCSTPVRVSLSPCAFCAVPVDAVLGMDGSTPCQSDSTAWSGVFSDDDSLC